MPKWAKQCFVKLNQLSFFNCIKYGFDHRKTEKPGYTLMAIKVAYKCCLAARTHSFVALGGNTSKCAALEA